MRVTTDAEKVIDPVVAETSSSKIQRSISNIHAVARHVLNIERGSEDEDVVVGVRPLGNRWNVEVKYAGFGMQAFAEDLQGALDEMLAGLVDHVARRLEEGTKLISDLKPG